MKICSSLTKGYWSPNERALRAMRLDEMTIAIREGCNEIDAPQLMPAGSSVCEDGQAGTTFVERD